MSAPSDAATLALFHAYPALADALPWTQLGRYPTPLERVTLELPGGGEREILVKRDDATAPVYGGNKVRKLEFLLAAARAAGARRLVTAGAAGSHHALATAIYGRELGFAVTLVLFPQRVTTHVRDTLRMDHAHGAELWWTRRMEGVPLAVLRARRRYARENAYAVPPGGSDPLGTIGYVSAGLELAAQLDAAGADPPAVHVAAGTLGTAAGLALGLTLAGRPLPIRATRITSRLVASRRALHRLVRATAAQLGEAGVDADAAAACALLDLRDDQIGAGYGRETEAGRTATETFGRAGLRLDPTYTAKAAADLLATPAGAQPSLYIHTLSAAEPIEAAADVAVSDLPAPFATYLTGAGERR